MRVLFLLIAFPEPARCASQHSIYPELVREFARRGHDVYVAALMEQRTGRSTYRQELEGVNVLFINCGDLFNVGHLRKAVTTLALPRRFFRAINAELAGVHFDLIVYPTPPVTLAPVVRRLKRQHACGTYLILRDIFPQNARDLGIIRDPVTFWFFRRKEKSLYRISDHIGCMSRGNIEYVLRHNSDVPSSKLEILYNWDCDPSGAAKSDDIRRKFNAEGKFLAVFAGNVGPAQELEFLLELAACYQDRDDILFLVLGWGTARDRIAAMAKQRGLRNVSVQTFLSRNDIDQLLRSADVGLVNLNRRFSIPNIPSKTGSYFAAGLPVLAAIDANTDYGQMLDECGAGLWSISGDLAAYQQNFDRLLNQPDLRRRMGESARRAFEERFTVQRAADTILQHV